MSSFRVVIDYGHGGSKPGATYGGVEEKTVNMLTGVEIYNHLRNEKNGHDIQVMLTRDADYDIPLRTRCALINAHHQQNAIHLVLSVHYNAATKPTAAGFEIYCVTSPSNGPVAAKAVAQAVMQANIPMRKYPVVTTEQLGRMLAILHNTQPTAILIEVGFLTNPVDRGNAADPAFRSKVAKATAQGIWNYLLDKEAP